MDLFITDMGGKPIKPHIEAARPMSTMISSEVHSLKERLSSLNFSSQNLNHDHPYPSSYDPLDSTLPTISQQTYAALLKDFDKNWKSDFQFIFLDENSCTYVVLYA